MFKFIRTELGQNLSLSPSILAHNPIRIVTCEYDSICFPNNNSFEKKSILALRLLRSNEEYAFKVKGSLKFSTQFSSCDFFKRYPTTRPEGLSSISLDLRRLSLVNYY